jgi:AraC-like DNA-binding protein
MHEFPPDDTSFQIAAFTTHDLPGAEQFAAFSAAYRGVFDVFHGAHQNEAFPASQKVWRLGKLVLVSARLPGPGHAFGLRHTWHPAPLDHWYALLPFRGAGPDSIREQTPPLSFHCLAKPFQVELEADGMLVLFIPRDFAALDFGAVLNQALGAGAGLLLADFLSSLCRRLPDLHPRELPGVLDAIRGLIAACTGSHDAAAPDARNLPELKLLERAKRRIDQQVAEPDLSPQSLCRDLHVSRSRLYRAFAPLGGISAYVRRQRLIHARNALLDADAVHPVARIAEQWGFSSASAFSRAFRYEFGESPQEICKIEIRKIGIRKTGRAAPAASDRENGGESGPAMPEDASRLHALLRGMRG